MASQRAIGDVLAASAESMGISPAAAVCPACGEVPSAPAIEQYGRYKLFACDKCGLQSWEPREMPGAQWYEQMYSGRDQELLPLEPGHKYFLEDRLAPRCGELLDIGCGTGNFLAAASQAGYQVTGIELDSKAARFAKNRLGLQNIYPLTISEFVKQNERRQFDVVTFFEVLEHQATPVEFLQKVRACLKPGGVVALSVPNRDRWQTGPDVLDYPPNHFLRWNVAALTNVLSAQSFDVLRTREQPAGVRHTAQMINMALRTGMSRGARGEISTSFRDVMQMASDEAAAALRAKPTLRQRLMRSLGRIKHAACFPLAVAALPYVCVRGLKGTYLYCLAQRRD